MTVEISLDREASPTRRGAHSEFRDAHAGTVADGRRDRKTAPVALVTAPGTSPALRTIMQSDERMCVRPASTNVKSRTRRIAFGPQQTVARHRESTRNLCTRPYFLVTWDTTCVPEEDHGMLRNKSHSRHVFASSWALDHGYTAVSIRDRLIDKAFVYCKNSRCKG
jgi:hypothetical protein